MADSVQISSSKWKQVEVGRVVLFVRGPYAGKLAAITTIIDHRRILVDGPSKTNEVPRHAAPLSSVSLTSIVIKIPRDIGKGALSKVWEKEEVDSKWAQTGTAKAAARKERRRNLTDFERFKVMRLRKQARNSIRQAHSAIRKSAK